MRAPSRNKRRIAVPCSGWRPLIARRTHPTNPFTTVCSAVYNTVLKKEAEKRAAMSTEEKPFAEVLKEEWDKKKREKQGA